MKVPSKEKKINVNTEIYCINF